MDSDDNKNIDKKYPAKLRTVVFQDNKISNKETAFTKIEMDLFTIILACLQENEQSYYLRVSDLLDWTQTHEKNIAYVVAGLKGLWNKTFAVKGESRTRFIRLLTSMDIPNVFYKDEVIEVRLDPIIYPYVFSLQKTFTVYKTNSFLSLTSRYSKILYVELCRWKTRKNVEMSLIQLQEMLGVSYSDQKSFRRFVLNPAIEEIQEKTNIQDIQVEPYRNKGKIAGYNFMFVSANIQLEIPLLPPQMNTKELYLYNRLVKDFGLTNKKASDLMDIMPSKDIAKLLYDINKLEVNKQIETNKTAYLIGCIKKMYPEIKRIV